MNKTTIKKLTGVMVLGLTGLFFAQSVAFADEAQCTKRQTKCQMTITPDSKTPKQQSTPTVNDNVKSEKPRSWEYRSTGMRLSM